MVYWPRHKTTNSSITHWVLQPAQPCATRPEPAFPSLSATSPALQVATTASWHIMKDQEIWDLPCVLLHLLQGKHVEGRQAQCPLLSSLLQGCPEANGRRWKGLGEGRDSASGKRKMMEMWLPVKGFFAHFQAHPFSSHFWIQVFFFFLNQSTFCWIDWVNNIIAWTGTYTS